MTEDTVSPLRRRMIEDMTIRRFTEKTQADYIRHVKTFADFLGKSPAKASAKDLRRWHLQLTASGASVSCINAAVSALRFFDKETLGRREMIEQMPFLRKPQQLPEVLSPDEVARLLRAAPGSPIAPAMPPPTRRGSTSGCRCTRCVTALPPTSSNRRRTCG